MTTAPKPSDTDRLIESAARGDVWARQRLLSRHRDRLKRLVAVRIDDRLAARVDPSDIVQDALQDATKHLDDYLKTRPLPFYLWLRRLTFERLTQARRRHILAQRRSVNREQQEPGLSDKSAAMLADRLISRGTGQLSRLLKDERRRRVLALLEELSDNDRDLLFLRYFEGLSNSEIAQVLNISVGAVMTRHTRALQRLRTLFGEERSEGER